MEEKDRECIEERLRKNIRVNLRLLRLKAGLTQKDIAGVLHLSRSTYSYYESGTTSPSVASLRILCEFYGIEEKDFFSDVDSELFCGKKRVRRKKS